MVFLYIYELVLAFHSYAHDKATETYTNTKKVINMKESNQLQERALQLLQERGVTIDDIAELVHFLQKISSKFRDVRMPLQCRTCTIKT